MKVVIQYVKQSEVSVSGKPVAGISTGYLLLVGIHHTDTTSSVEKLAQRILTTRLIPDQSGKINRTIKDIHGQILCIPQFTLIADTTKGHRPSFSHAAGPKQAKSLFEHFVACLSQSGLTIKSGIFGANMQLSLTNDGPITLILNA